MSRTVELESEVYGKVRALMQAHPELGSDVADVVDWACWELISRLENEDCES